MANNCKKARDRDPALTWAVPPALEVSHGEEALQASLKSDEVAVEASRLAFLGVAEAHLSALVLQQLAAEGVQNTEQWAPTVVKLAQQAAGSLSPVAITANGTIDPRQCIKVKRVVGGGEPATSSMVQGVVFRKNVAHKRMRTNISQANIMLLAGALEWQPAESKLQQFDALLSEEQAFLQAAVTRIASFSPDVLVVERSVARYAQELLLEKGIALVLNVKRDLLERIARCTDAVVVPSVAQISSHSLGYCKEFEVESMSTVALPASIAAMQLDKSGASRPSMGSSVPSSPLAAQANEQGHLIADAAALRKSAPSVRSGPNSLMLFKGCPRPLGCTILLKGNDASELTKVKRVAAFAAYVAYWNRLEAELLADQLTSAVAATPQPIAEFEGSAQPASVSAPVQSEKIASTFWGALAGACAEASARDAAEARGSQLIVSPSPHVIFAGIQEQELDGACEVMREQQPAAAGQCLAPASSAPSLASSPTKSGTGATGLPATPSTAALDRGEAVLRNLVLSEDSSASDPWVVPADADGATITVTGPTSVGGAKSRQQTGMSTPLPNSASQLSLPEAAVMTTGPVTEAPDSPQLDPLSQAVKEIERRLADEGEEEDGSEDAGHVEPAQPPSADLAVDAPRLGRISTRSGIVTADSSPKEAPQTGSMGGGDFIIQPGSNTPDLTYSSQQLWVSISCKNPAKGILCEPPHTHCMHFYAKEDMPLAHFLAAATPTNRKCAHPTCGEGAMLHLRSFMHGDGLVTLSSVRLPAGQELPGRDKGQIWLWLRPLGKEPEVQEDVRRVALSAEAACISFAHLLILLLDARYLMLGGQSLQRDYVRYLGSGSTVLCLHYTHITLHGVCLPPRSVALSLEAEVAWLVEEIKGLTEEADEAFGAIKYAVVQQLQHLEDDDPDFVQMWISNLGEARSAFMDKLQEARTGFDIRTLREGVVSEQQELLVKAVWDLNRLRRLLACEVLQWATALHEGTPVARAGPPQVIAAVRDGRQASMDAAAASDLEKALSIPQAAAAQQQQQQQVLPSSLQARPVGRDSGVDLPVAEGTERATVLSPPPVGAGLPPLPPEIRPKAQVSEVQAPVAAQSVQRPSFGHQRHSSASLGQHFKSTMPRAAGPSQLPSANYAPSLRDSGDSGTPPTDTAAASGSEQLPPIPIGLVARYISLFDQGRNKGGSSPSQAQQRTFDWVQQASPSDTDVSGTPIFSHSRSSSTTGTDSFQHPPSKLFVSAQGASEPASHYVCPSDDEEDDLAAHMGDMREHGTASEGLQGGAAQSAVDDLRRPSMRIDLANPDPGVGQLVSAFSPRSSGPEGGAQEEQQSSGEQSAFERLASRFGRLSLRRSLSERRHSLTSASSITVGFVPPDLQAKDEATAEQLTQSVPAAPPVGAEAPEVDLDQPSTAAPAAASADAAVIAEPKPSLLEATSSDSAAASTDAALQAQLSGVSASHFEEWGALLTGGGLGSLQEPEIAPDSPDEGPLPALAPVLGPLPVLAQSLQKESLASAASSPAKLSPPALSTTAITVSSAAPLQATATAASAPAELSTAVKQPGVATMVPASSAPSVEQQLPVPSQRQPSKLKQLLGKLRLEPQPGQAPLVAGKVELSGRSLLPPSLDDMHVPIFDEEPTSVIAYFLSTRVYQQYLRDAVVTILYGNNRGGPPSSAGATPENGSPGGVITSWQSGRLSPRLEGGVIASDPVVIAMQQQLTAAQPSPLTQPHSDVDRSKEWQVLFSEQRLDCQLSIEDMSPGMPWGRAKFQAVVYYAPQFSELRRKCVAGGEAAFLASISRCRKWASQGGKSNVYFAKTRDDRYIVKQLSKSERQSFLEFAPDYFRYVSTTLHRGQESCLAKILGVYQVSVKYANSSVVPFGGGAGAKDGVIDILVMENIFYGRSISRIYDLKGSERDRYAADNPAIAGAVLLDENLKEVNLSSPTLVGPNAYARLQRALWSDTAFLSGLGVMDYSLLVGIDKQEQQLVLGVIDFIRQYTWDKQVETWVKKSGILGGAGKDPTVISPKQYSRRFRVAISGYFTVVPSLQQPPALLDPDAV